MIQQDVLQPGTVKHGVNTEHSKGVHRVRYNTTAVAGTINPDGLGCTTIRQHWAVCPTCARMHRHAPQVGMQPICTNSQQNPQAFTSIAIVTVSLAVVAAVAIDLYK